ncbi:hypothetical protein [Streptomyces subrutilus]|uniref:hypothetical protein n=1 Tax=Streptomyces subrutilus TaxID=36818 RepID=UPI003F4CC695
MRLRDVAGVCGLTERTVQTIVTDLESDGYLRRVRDGRRNRYEISTGAVFRHPAEAGVQVAGLLALLTGAAAAPDAPSAAADAGAGAEDTADAEDTDAPHHHGSGAPDPLDAEILDLAPHREPAGAAVSPPAAPDGPGAPRA